MTKHVVVVGCGIIGACTAVELVSRGHSVTMIDPHNPGSPNAASYGNGSWISPASIIPMSMPGLWRKVPGFLMDSRGPLVIRWRHLPGLTPWLLRFLNAGLTQPRVERTVGQLAALLDGAPRRHLDYARMIGAPDLVVQKGVIYAYPDCAMMAGDQLAWNLRREHGVDFEIVEGDRLRSLAPDLSPRYTVAYFVPGAAHSPDTGAYVSAIAAHACAIGAVFRKDQVQGFEFSGDRLKAVRLPGETIACDATVIAAGAWSRHLAAKAGDRVPMVSERGYNVTIRDSPVMPDISIMPCDGRMANTPTGDGLRCSGQVELASLDAPPDWRRAQILIDHANNTYPALAEARLEHTRWMGHRPSTPDGLPVIGASTRSADVIHAFGHGHMGLCAGPATADLVASLVDGARPAIDISAFDAKRFRLWRKNSP
ncbi:NAD(P)/FAD-dependent oxidoreductase [Oricola sp.]|uniref:NAD(P)/FAD-dependent oxidoreductase n=1 Tax=Oricola sp. TaxID=1979950 RepID=UPI0035131B9A